MSFRQTLYILMILFVLSCATMKKKDYGYGECREYEPWMCWEGSLECETDQRGCKVCSCL
ncbi:MAG: hypothetical protein A3I05_09600 [Deltaproteobacteria bacterium RIFCSPLOWO2_02_FULL_44_10]|nr:MAG: hypothetical protein A3C46_00055 [Deltaproteobacteria bacterium RIFCSPHIGHO2_02_FULL_44_16]OGQ46819.1 MAG: hypothetical protein A3I05_09600 [Deltaproteobacteria bacterium RIFCSPLOWO2_02_FULL_44_10]